MVFHSCYGSSLVNEHLGSHGQGKPPWALLTRDSGLESSVMDTSRLGRRKAFRAPSVPKSHTDQTVLKRRCVSPTTQPEPQPPQLFRCLRSLMGWACQSLDSPRKSSKEI